jgi:hypothetical protein
MPEISRFFGIVIRMYYNDHNPPHFHAIYGRAESLFGIDPVAELTGDLPGRAVALVLDWAALHQDELRANWHLLRGAQAPNDIEPLK